MKCWHCLDIRKSKRHQVPEKQPCLEMAPIIHLHRVPRLPLKRLVGLSSFPLDCWRIKGKINPKVIFFHLELQRKSGPFNLCLTIQYVLNFHPLTSSMYFKLFFFCHEKEIQCEIMGSRCVDDQQKQLKFRLTCFGTWDFLKL